MKTTPFSDADSKSILGDLHFRSNRLAESEALLKEALKLDPNSIQGNVSFGLLKARQRNFPEAKKALEKAISLDDKNYIAHYQYAYALSREGMDENNLIGEYNEASADKMRVSLKKSIALNPDFAKSYELFAFVSIVQNQEIDEAIKYMQKALALAPGNQWYLIRLAELYGRKDDYAAARNIAEKVLQSASDDELRNYAKYTIDNIISRQSYLERVNNANKDDRGNIQSSRQIIIESEEPLSEEELADLQKKAMQEMVYSLLRKPEAGEKRILSYLSRIECDSRGIVYTVKNGNEILKLTSADFQSLKLNVYGVELNNQEFGCGTIKNDIFAVITFKQKVNAKTKTEGEVVSIEVVPKDFKLQE